MVNGFCRADRNRSALVIAQGSGFSRRFAHQIIITLSPNIARIQFATQQSRLPVIHTISSVNNHHTDLRNIDNPAPHTHQKLVYCTTIRLSLGISATMNSCRQPRVKIREASNPLDYGYPLGRFLYYSLFKDMPSCPSWATVVKPRSTALPRRSLLDDEHNIMPMIQ